jgi:hypothetical protein
MTKAELRAKVALLESVNDQLSTEVTYLDYLMRCVGFAYGVETFKATAEEIMRANSNQVVQ